MRPEGVMFTLLQASSQLVAKVGTRIFQTRMGENQGYPALVLETVSGQLLQPINAQAGQQLVQTRIQVTSLAKNVLDCKQLLDYVRQACEFQSGNIAVTQGGVSYTVRVQGIWRDAIGADGKDDALGVYYQSHDYLVSHFET